MARRKRTWPFHRNCDHSFPSKRRRKRPPFNYMQYIEQISNSFHKNATSDSDEFEAQDSPAGHVISVASTNKLIEVENALKSTLDASTIEWVINSLANALDSDDIDVCFFLEKHDFFRRSDVFGMVLEMLTSDAPDINGWVESLVTLVLAISKKQTIKTKFIKTILRFLSQIKSFKDPSVENQIENALDILEKREKYESLQDDCHSEIKMRTDIKIMLHKLINCEIFPTTEMVVKDKHLPLMLRDLRKPYKSPAHYLLEQFSLFLEDFIGPMRMGLKRYIDYVQSEETQGSFRDGDVRIYKRIRLLDENCIAGSGVCLQVQFDTSTMKKIRWDSCNFLQYGNLVCLTYDDCSELTYALIANRDVEELSNGRIYLRVVGEDLRNISILRQIDESRLVMIESKAFYPTYNFTLESLQTMAKEMLNKNKNIPFAKYLVHLNNDVSEPFYTRQPNFEIKMADFRCFLKDEKLKQNLAYDEIPILEVEKWPTMLEMGLNEDQYKALKKCLTKKIGILQGPPGTGKTWMGLRIMEFFLCNHNKLFTSEERRPILLLSYTNHALDQFFEKLLESTSLTFLFRSKTQPFVRVGGRCKNERVKTFLLKEHRKRTMYWSKNRNVMFNSLNSVKYIDTLLKYLQNGIISVDFLYSEKIMSKFHHCSLTYTWDFDKILEWLWICDNSCNPETENRTTAFQNAEVDELYLEESDKRVLDDDDEHNDKGKEIENAILKLFTFTTKRVPNRLKDLSVESRENMLSFVRRNLDNDKGIMRRENVQQICNIWILNIEDRWRLYRWWIKELTVKLQDLRKDLVYHFHSKNKDVERERLKEDLAILKSCYLVGMTTTGAASNMNLLREVQPRIVVVEEAAQVHEQHVIGCLTNHLQHLILIGDHKQLRPAMNNHALKCAYETDVSLMERLVINNFPFQCLTKQHRMRPEICRLLTPAIYPSLENHSTVFTYPNVRGMKQNLYFINHQNPENQSNFSTSYANEFEVEMIAKLYKYLFLQGYSNSDITILSAYNDQVRKIRKKVTEISQKLSATKERVHITTVDNFQGEENRIILLSLVRSNKQCKPGHLSDPQRICVSLSRAKEGLFVFGDFEMINNRRNPIWLEIIKVAKENEIFGNSLTLVCQNHPETITKIHSPQDFEKVPDGGCDKLCSTQLECGHVCERKCHADSSIHSLPCQKPCLKILCKLGHPCRRKCHEYCGQCKEKVEKVFSSCEHKLQISCFESSMPGSSYRVCQSKCNRKLQCGHSCPLKCFQDCNTVACKVEIKVQHPQCGHETMVKCCDKNYFHCTKPCSKVLMCGHTCKGCCDLCSNGRLHIPCKENCSRILVCGHNCSRICCTPCPPCDKLCERGCVHKEIGSCNHLCSEYCNPCQELCDWNCCKQCKNKYNCFGKCFEDCNRPLCKKRCDESLKCKKNHRCIGLCGEKCPSICKRCDKSKVNELLNGSKSIDDARFVELIGCGHIFEVDFMDEYMGLHTKNEGFEDKRVLLKSCPKCSTPIRRAGRYRNVILETEWDLMEVNRLCENTLFSDIFVSFNLKDLIPYCDQITQLFTDRTINPVYCMNVHVKTVLDGFLNKANPRMKKLFEIKTPSTIQGMKTTFCVMVKWILFYSDICFTEDALEKFVDEVERFLTHADLILIKDELENTLSSEDKDRIDFHIKTIGCPDGETFNRKDILSAQLLLNKIKRDIPSSCLRLLESKRISLQDVKCGKHGIWFKCRKGHIYLSEVGGTINDPRCPDCLSTPNVTQCSPTEERNDGSTGLAQSADDVLLSDSSEDPL